MTDPPTTLTEVGRMFDQIEDYYLSAMTWERSAIREMALKFSRRFAKRAVTRLGDPE